MAKYRAVKSRNSLPAMCYTTLPSSGELVIIKCGENGYYTTEYSTDNAHQNQMFAREWNKIHHVTRAQEAAMMGGSMFGWHTPAANPSNYTRTGMAKQPSVVFGRREAVEK